MLSCSSCKEKEVQHLSSSRMQQVLFDLYLAEAYSTMVPKDSFLRITEKNKDSLALFYQRVFRSHKITQKQFEQSMKWYTEHPEHLDTIYTRLIPEISKLEGVY